MKRFSDENLWIICLRKIGNTIIGSRCNLDRHLRNRIWLALELIGYNYPWLDILRRFLIILRRLITLSLNLNEKPFNDLYILLLRVRNEVCKNTFSVMWEFIFTTFDRTAFHWGENRAKYILTVIWRIYKCRTAEKSCHYFFISLYKLSICSTVTSNTNNCKAIKNLGGKEKRKSLFINLSMWPKNICVIPIEFSEIWTIHM